MALVSTKSSASKTRTYTSSDTDDDDYSSIVDEGNSVTPHHHHPPLLPKKMNSVAEALTVFMRIVSSAKESLNKILIRGEYDEYQNVKSMHCTARLAEMLNDYSAKLQSTADIKYCEEFLMEEIRMRMIAYWKIVLKRMVDCMALHMLYSIQNLVNRDMETEVVGELMAPHGGGVERMLEESPAVAGKREKLNRSIKLLRESKEVVGNMMDQIAAYGD
ncbi:hypothetical protein L6452_11163 [Arctium lappa]|uniref:Uncharacterized protein n=1 Tax=Arctium lappa TaxID=4217 RepID=A0ACB9DP14_ARCLA|nr:hypothetical protein L6452_11163 [Arctium lappa]